MRGGNNFPRSCVVILNCRFVPPADPPPPTISPDVQALLKDDAAVLSHARVQELWRSAAGMTADVKTNLCDLLHAGVLRLAPLPVRAWGPSRKFTRQASTMLGAGAEEMKWKVAGRKPRSKAGAKRDAAKASAQVAAAASGEGNSPLNSRYKQGEAPRAPGPRQDLHLSVED